MEEIKAPPAPKEIERKFLLREALTSELLENYPHKEKIKQGFLCTDVDKVIRIRITQSNRAFGNEAFLTVKGRSTNGGITRTEIETVIPVEVAEQLLSNFGGNVIEKTRYRIKCYGLEWEVDEFHGVNEGLWVAEVELESEDQGIVKPSWVGKEVSSDPKFTNVALSLRPYSQWTDEEREK